MTIYDKLRMRIRTWTEGLNVLFDMGSELEGEVDEIKGGVVSDVTLTEVDKHYTLTISYEDGTSDVVTWDDSTVGIEDITMTYQDGVYILTIILTDGTRYTFSIPVGNVVTEQELQDAIDTINVTITAMNVGSPDDIASSTGSLWARMKNAVARITTNESNISNLQTADTNNVKKTGTSVVTGDIQVPTPSGNSSVISKGWANDITEGTNNLLHKTGNESGDGMKFLNVNKYRGGNSSSSGWFKIAEYPMINERFFNMRIMCQRTIGEPRYIADLFVGSSASSYSPYALYTSWLQADIDTIRVCRKNDQIIIYAKNIAQYDRITVLDYTITNIGDTINPDTVTRYLNSQPENEPTTADYDEVKTPSKIPYINGVLIQ